jgi:hypothetical protein
MSNDNKAKTPKKSSGGAGKVAEAVVFALFVFAGYAGAVIIKRPDLFIDTVKTYVAIALASFATLVFGYILWLAFRNK